MNDWQEKLKEKYPLTLKNISYFECSEGWSNLLDSLCSIIENHIKLNQNSELYAVQIKEKFGSLRFYMSLSDDFIDDAIESAENQSSHICEFCGNPGKNQKIKGWFKTVCEQHQEILSAKKDYKINV